jgi:hypothetical protein
MTTNDYPVINGHVYDHSSVEINIMGTIFTGVKEISYSDELEPGEARGTRPNALGFTVGEHKAEGSMTVYLADWRGMLQRMGNGWGKTPINITVNYTDEFGDTITDRLRQVRISKREKSSSAGADPIEVKLDLKILLPIEEDGLSIV